MVSVVGVIKHCPGPEVPISPSSAYSSSQNFRGHTQAHTTILFRVYKTEVNKPERHPLGAKLKTTLLKTVT